MTPNRSAPAVHFESPILGQEWSIIRVTGVEAVSQLFEFHVVAVSKFTELQWISLDELLGKPIHLTIDYHEEQRHVHGVIRHAADLPTTTAGRSAVELTVVPSIWFLSINQRCRIFQGESVRKIIEKVFEGFDVAFDLADDYAPHNYCVQYLESDLSFACRLMEKSGIFYYFEHDEHGHRLAVTDRSIGCPAVSDREGVVQFDWQAGGTRTLGRIRDWRRSQSVFATHWTSRDHHYQLQQPILDAGEQTAEHASEEEKKIRLHHGERLTIHDQRRQHGAAHRLLEVFEYPAGVAHSFDPASTTSVPIEPMYVEHRRREKRRSEAAAAEAIVVAGGGDSVRLRAGARFMLEGHGRADGGYFLTRVEHSIQCPLPEASHQEVSEYSNRFHAIPAALSYRPPRRTPSPSIAGSQTAVVVGPAGEEIHTDDQGRIKVRFHWDRDGGSSCWMRVAQPWSGKNYGFFALPRVGTEVVVEFEDADPEKPMVVGCVYNSAQQPPFEMPYERTVTGLKTHTDRGAREDFHGMYFDDASGSEMVRIRSQKDVLLEAKSEIIIAAPNGLTTLANGNHLLMHGGGRLGAGAGRGGDAGPRAPAPGPALLQSESYTVGSGAGGGAQTTPAWLQVKPTVNGTSPFVVSVNAVLGASGGIYIGQRFVYNLPGSSQIWIDPFTLLGVASHKWLAGSTYAIGLTGKNEILYSSVANITYGGEFKVRRGPAFEATGASSNWAKTFGGLHAAVVTAASIMPFLQSLPSMKNWAPILAGGGTGLAQILQAILFQIEQGKERVNVKWFEGRQGADLMEQAILQAGERNRTAARDLNLLSERIILPMEEHARSSKTETAVGRYMIESKESSVIVLANQGVGIASRQGSVVVGPRHITITASAADSVITAKSLSFKATTPYNGIVYLGNEGEFNGLDGDFYFQACNAGVSMNFREDAIVSEVVLNNNGVKASCESHGSRSEIQMGPTSIRLRVGGASITITANGVTINGPKLNLAADTALQLAGTNVNHKLAN